jgi:glycosyltransferase involved in cell wall biosynthesis
MEREKAEGLMVMHAPGRDGKAVAKGTPEIERVIAGLQEEIDFDYLRLMHLTLAECLEVKGSAHVVIDQMPPSGAIHGLGRSGLEALAAGSAVVTAMYDTSVLGGFFEPPPALDAPDAEALETALRSLLADGGRMAETRQASLEWARENVELEPWLNYVAKYI